MISLDIVSPAVELQGVTFGYDDEPILRDVNLSIPQGDFVSIIGPNGGGKTTLLRLLLGLLTPSKGRVLILGQLPLDARPLLGYMPQSTNLDPLFPISVEDVVLMGRLGCGGFLGRYSKQDRTIAQDCLVQVGLADHRKRPYAQLSGGQRQRVLIARSLASHPRVLLLDEPTANLDIRVQQDFYELLKSLNKTMTVILVSHDVGLVSSIVKTVVCVEGRQGRVEMHCSSDLSGETIRDTYGMDVRLVRHDLHHHDHLEHHHHAPTDHFHAPGCTHQQKDIP